MTDGQDTALRSPTKLHLLAALIVFSVPFPYYLLSRSLGWLPSAAEWWAQGTNHGPWRWEWPMALVLLPLYALPLLGLLAFVRELAFAVRARRLARIPLALCVGAAFFALAYIQGSVVFWTVD
jgi:hypothetical protein